MAQVLKVDEWQSASKKWHVADVHTWTGWNEMAEVLNVFDLDSFIDFLNSHYHAVIDNYFEDKDFLMFHWEEKDYKHAHQFKLDVNRIARKKNYLVERSF